MLWTLAGVAVLFAMLTTQDRGSAAPTVSYTVFTQQVAAKNVATVFSQGEDIQGVLRQPQPLPGRAGQTYLTFSTTEAMRVWSSMATCRTS